MSTLEDMKIFAGRNSIPVTEAICAHLGEPMGRARTSLFPDGELLVKLDEDVRGRDCFVVLSTCRPVNDNLAELMIFIDCLRRASASRVTVVLPYFGYARQDRKDEGRVPITAKLVANVITAAGADRVLAMDLHAAQIQGFFDLPVDHLTATPVFYDYFKDQLDGMPDLCLVSPDLGNVKVAERFGNLLGGDLAIIYKRRVSDSEVKSAHLIGSVEGKTVLMVDDMISTAGTVCEAAQFVMNHGAREVHIAATHPVMVGPALERLASSPIKRIVTTNTIPCDNGRLAPIEDRLTVLSVAHLLGDAISNIHHNRSVSALFSPTSAAKR